MRDFLQLVGQALAQQCPRDVDGALLYAEVEDGVISSSVFFTAASSVLVFRYASEQLEDLVYEFWERGQDGVPPRSWAAIEYQLTGSKLDVGFSYSNQFSKNEGQHERRPRVVARRFPGFTVDFSNPGE
jgi:hypothetical protein